MPASVAPVVIWACVVAFVLCLAAALLVLFELWTPKSRATRKWLLSGVLFSAVGAVGSFAAAQFSGTGGLPAPDANQVETVGQTVRPPRPPAPPPAAPDPVPPSPEPQEPPPAPLPAAVRDWAAVLGPRPGFEAALRATYPGCVARLREGGEALGSAQEAADCRRALAHFHREWILPVYNRKASYEENLERQEQALRARNLEPDILPRYSHVVSEMARLQGEQWDAFVALDRRVGDDITSCQRRRCRSAA